MGQMDMESKPKPSWLALGLLIGALALLAAACAPPESELGDPPPGSTLVVLRVTTAAGSITVQIDGITEGVLTALGIAPACSASTLVEEATTGHITKFVKPGVHVVSWSGAASGVSSVTTTEGVCTYKGV